MSLQTLRWIIVLCSIFFSSLLSAQKTEIQGINTQIQIVNKFINNNNDSATVLLNSLKSNQTIYKYIDLKWEVDLLEVKLLFAQGSFKASIEKGEKLLSECERSSNTSIRARTMMALSRSYQFTGYRPRQLELNQKSLDLLSVLRDTTAIIITINSIGDVFKKTEDLDKSLSYYRRAYRIAELTNDTLGLAQSLKNIGTYHLLSNNTDSCIYYLRKSLKLFQTTDEKDQECLSWIRLGRGYHQNKQLDSADYCYQNARFLSGKIRSIPWLGRSYHYLGNTEKSKENFDKAITYYDSALVELYKVEDVLLLKGTFLRKSQTYMRMGMPDSALHLFQVAQMWDDTIQQRKNLEMVANLQWDYEVQKKEKRINFLKEKSEILDQKNQAQKKARTYLFIALGITLLLAIILYQLYKQRNKSLSQEKKLRALDKEKAALEMELKDKKLTTLTMEISQKSQDIQDIHGKLKNLEDTIKPDSKLEMNVLQELRVISRQLKSESGKEKEWQQFKLQFEQVHSGFFDNLKKHHPALTAYDLKLCAFFHMNLGIKQVSNILNVSYDAVKKQRTRMRKKMNLDPEMNLLVYLNKMSS